MIRLVTAGTTTGAPHVEISGVFCGVTVSRGSRAIHARRGAWGLHHIHAAMSASPFARTEIPPGPNSDAPLALDLADESGNPTSIIAGWFGRIPRSWVGMSGYLLAGVFLGLILIVALSVTRPETAASAGVVTDNIVHVHARDIGDACWRSAAASKSGTAARMTVSMEVGLDGKVRSAVAAGESPTMRNCIESHVKSWEFLPQATSSQMVLPFEIDPR